MDLQGLIRCHSVPCPISDPSLYHATLTGHYSLVHESSVLGYVSPAVIDALQQDADRLSASYVLDHDKSTLSICGDDADERTRHVSAITQAWRKEDRFAVLRGWRDELYGVYGPGKQLLVNIERAASPLFGVVTYGVHMTAFVRAEAGVKVWVSRRSKTKQTYPGMLDNTVGGGIESGEDPFDSLVREASEEASLAADLVRCHATAVGTVTYWHRRDPRAGGETGLLQPECQYVYDLELDQDVRPTPNDEEVENFELLPVAELRQALGRGEFKPNCALVLLDFFVRHGILTPGNDRDYVEIVTRLHRRFHFPVA